MSSEAPGPGWHPDPYDPETQWRWWDGERWTDHVQPRHQVHVVGPDDWSHDPGPAWSQPGGNPPWETAGQPSDAGPANPGPAGWGGGAGGWTGAPGGWARGPGGWARGSGGWGHRGSRPGRGGWGGGTGGFASRNSLSLWTGGVVAVYLVLAFTSRIVLIGILPLMLSIRAMGRREPLAPFALAAAILAIVVALGALGLG